MKANNYVVKDANETITFEGIVKRSLSQAFFLTFVTALGMASLALVLQIQFNDLGALTSCMFLQIVCSTCAFEVCPRKWQRVHFGNLFHYIDLFFSPPSDRHTELVLFGAIESLCWHLLLEVG